MYRGMTLACPACGGALEYTTASLPVHGCRGCGGMWLGPDAAMHVLQGRGGALENGIVQSDERASLHPTGKPAVPDGAVRRCPSCDLEMAPLTIRDVRVDSCPAHGTWFDRLEVTRVTKRIIELQRKEKRRQGEAGLPSLDDLVDDTKVIAEAGAKAIAGLGVTIIAELWTWLSTHHTGCRCHECTRIR